MQRFLDAWTDPAVSDKTKIVIDQREDPEFDRLLGGLGAVVERKVLEVGDFLCSARLAVERKTRSDFEQSVIDGRLFSQLQNLGSNYSRVVVLVEGTVNEERINRNALLGAYSAIIADFGASLIFVRDMEKSAELIFSMAKHEQLARKQPMRVFAKRKTLTLAQSQRAIVEMLPMIGPKLAKALLNHFGSIERVFSASEKELLEVENMGSKKAKIIRAVLSKDYDDSEDELQEL